MVLRRWHLWEIVFSAGALSKNNPSVQGSLATQYGLDCGPRVSHALRSISYARDNGAVEARLVSRVDAYSQKC